MFNLPFLKPLSIKIALVWNARLAPFRPYIAKTSTDLLSVLRFDAKTVPAKKAPPFYEGAWILLARKTVRRSIRTACCKHPSWDIL